MPFMHVSPLKPDVYTSGVPLHAPRTTFCDSADPHSSSDPQIQQHSKLEGKEDKLNYLQVIINKDYKL